MLRALRRSFLFTPLVDLSAAHFIPPPSFVTMPSLGFFSQGYNLIHDLAIVRDRQDVVSQGSYGVGTGILVTSLAMRLIFTPFHLYFYVTSQKKLKLAHEFQEYRILMAKLWSSKDYKNLWLVKETMAEMRYRYNIKDFSGGIPLLQVPPVLIFYWTLVEMAANSALFPGITTEGFLWFTNLSVPDPYYGLSIILATSTFTALHVSDPHRNPRNSHPPKLVHSQTL